jgi:hypothetical protein
VVREFNHDRHAIDGVKLIKAAILAAQQEQLRVVTVPESTARVAARIAFPAYRLPGNLFGRGRIWINDPPAGRINRHGRLSNEIKLVILAVLAEQEKAVRMFLVLSDDREYGGHCGRLERACGQ